MDVVEVVRQCGGVARRAALPRGAVERALAAGSLVAPRKGIVADPALPPPLLLALSLGGVLSCASAAVALGFELANPPTVPHVTIPRGLPLPRGLDVVVHRRAIEATRGISEPSRTAADCARCLPAREAVVAVDAALRRGVLMADVLGHLWGQGSGQARRTVRRGDGRSDSAGETIGRLALEDHGFTVEPQVFIRGVGFVDLLVEGRVVVEVDGFAYHSDPKQFANDRRRDAALTAMGYVVLRFTWVDVLRNAERMVAVVALTLSRLQ